jgi:phage-related protein
LHGFGSADVQQISASDEGGTYRAVYTVRFEKAVYVLHAFAKKSKSGSRTPKEDMRLVEKRLMLASKLYLEKYDPKASR